MYALQNNEKGDRRANEGLSDSLLSSGKVHLIMLSVLGEAFLRQPLVTCDVVSFSESTPLSVIGR